MNVFRLCSFVCHALLLSVNHEEPNLQHIDPTRPTLLLACSFLSLHCLNRQNRKSPGPVHCTNFSSFPLSPLQVRNEPYPDRQSDFPGSLPPSQRETLANTKDDCSFHSESAALANGGKHMLETWLLLEYCDKGSLQVLQGTMQLPS